MNSGGSRKVRELLGFRVAQWLLANGATFPKIQWPARSTIGGVRGTVALEDIEVVPPLCIVVAVPVPVRLCTIPPHGRARCAPTDQRVHAVHPLQAHDCTAHVSRVSAAEGPLCRV